ncbi:DNA methylase family protein (plasmid) [Bosea sp. RAC05]|nr:DNA methylase family protein [Bosea sp. RAC05]
MDQIISESHVGRASTRGGIASGECTIMHGDCRELLATIAPGSIDLVIADPPYNETKLKWDKEVKGWLKALLPLMAPHASLWCFGSLRFFMNHKDEFSPDWSIMQEVVWEKQNGAGPPDKGRFNRVHELIVQFRPTAVPPNQIRAHSPMTFDAVARKITARKGPGHRGEYASTGYETQDGGARRARSVQRFKSMHHAAVHPTQKPGELVRMLIESYSNPGDLVLDPFGGSGTTGVSALMAGRRAILIEKLPHFVALCEQRIEEATLQPELIFG